MSTTQYIFKLYFTYALKFKKFLFPILIWQPVLLVLHQIIPPIIASDIITRLSSGDYVQGNVWESFGKNLAVYTLLVVLMSTLGWRIIVYCVWKLEMNVVRNLMVHLFNHYTALDMEFHNNSFGGSLVSKSNKLVGSYIRVADTFVFEIYGMLIIFLASGAVLWPRAPQFVVVFYIMAILFIFIAVRITRKIRSLSSVEAEKQNKVTGYLADMITNVLTVKSFSKSEYEGKRFAKATDVMKNATNRLMWAQLIRENIFALITSSLGSIALIIAVITVVVYDAEIGTVFLVYTYTANLTVRLWDFAQRTLRNINKSLGDAEEGALNLMRQPEILDPVNPKQLNTDHGDISIHNMEFSHDSNELFKGFNLRVEKGKKIGLVGYSGSGKTTLTKLLLRLKDIDSGSIKINDVDIRDVTQDDLRRVMSYVPQEPLLFHRSLKENISYSKLNATEEEIIRAAKNAHAHEFISKLENGYDTLVGERGVKLSGGQKQRVAIARAMLKDAPILLLDEATSALDSESEKLIQEALWKLMEGKTAIVIAHRLSTIQKMDNIIVLDKGRIVEEGTHKQLLKNKKGLYSKLWAHQSGGFIE